MVKNLNRRGKVTKYCKNNQKVMIYGGKVEKRQKNSNMLIELKHAENVKKH